MSPQDCLDKAATCDAQAQTNKGTPAAADWEDLARHWRLLAADRDESETLARLMWRARPPTLP
ncbi:hypothetical protein [Brevundimonas sp.]|uniref:hypothetical protein n=1 Tax=Brevundimonas sp. TaxID=1871086 RepID=UPI002D6EE157|nr:hypothetical protein [Brevundimonas sp.]HYC99019.1 hypothetical protein [Brevundimonas sp.]